MYNVPLYSYPQPQPKQSDSQLKKSVLQLNLHPFHHQTLKVTLISNPMGCVTSPMVAQPYFEYKCDNNMRIQLQQVVVHDKHKQQAKHTQSKR